MSDQSGQAANLIDLLRMRADQDASHEGYTFLASNLKSDVRISYAELDRRARAIAARLIATGAAGEPVLLIFPPGIDYICALFACLYAGAIALPAYPPDPFRLARSLPRLQGIVRHAGVTRALTTSIVLDSFSELLAGDPQLSRLAWLATDAVPAELAILWRAPAIRPESVALLQYTSGSTGEPKGVTLTHANLLHNLERIRQAFGHTAESRGVVWLPPYHDMGLIGGILQPLYAGFPVWLMSPATFLRRPLRWLDAISRVGATTSGGPDFAYDLCVRKVTADQRSRLDLSHWAVAFNGSEPIRAQTLDRFFDAFGPCGFRKQAFFPCYGLAEGTLMVTGGTQLSGARAVEIERKALEQHRAAVQAQSAGDSTPRDTLKVVGCGSAAPQRLEIVDPDTRRRCQPDHIGEIWIAGPSVAAGYWRDPAATAHTFGAVVADSGEGPYLRTGDLGFLHEGQLHVTGRLKDVIIVRGRNHYPHDIEQTAQECHPILRPGCGAVFTVETADTDQVVLAQEVRAETPSEIDLDLNAVVSAIRRAVVGEHNLRLHTVLLLCARTLPKTSSGKVRRSACRAAFLSGELSPHNGPTVKRGRPVQLGA